MYEIVKKNLEEKMKLIVNLEKSKDGLILAEKKYINYLTDSKELAIGIRDLALEDKIKPSLLQDIFMTFMLPQFLFLFKNEEYPSISPSNPSITYPPFWNEKIENKFHLYRKIRNSQNRSVEENNFEIALWSYKVFPRLEIKSKELLDKVHRHAKDTLPAIRKLHDDLIKLIDSVYSARKIDDDIKYQNGEHPVTDVVGDKGYLKISVRSKLIQIGGVDTRKFRLLQVLCMPNFGLPIKTETIFAAITKPRDANNSRLKDPFHKRDEIITIIENAIRELCKKETGLNGKIKFKHDESKQHFWVKFEGS